MTDNSNPCANSSLGAGVSPGAGVGPAAVDPEPKAAKSGSAKSKSATKPATAKKPAAKIVRAYTLPHFANRSKLEASYGARSASFACTAQCWLSWPSTR